MRLGRQFHHKHPPLSSSRKLLITLTLFTFVGAAVIADLFWASSSAAFSAFRYVATTLPLNRSPRLIFSSKSDTLVKGKDPKKYDAQGRVLTATFADLPAPKLQWEQMPTAPVPRLDGAAIQIKNIFYVFAGYGTINYVHSHVDIYNFTDNTWVGKFDMPKKMAHSHLGMATDGRYIYIVNGQYGPQCRGPTAHTFVLDTETKQWNELPPLPVPRYAPATQLWRGRLHVMGGSGINRYTPELDHWSLAVKDGKPLEKEWRTEVPIPRGGPHRACVVVDDRIMVIGGQEGDFMAKPGSSIFKCSRRHEVVYPDVYMLDDDMKWKSLPPMPKANSHIEFAWALVNRSIIIAGGTTDKHPVTKKMILNREIFQFDLDTQKWSVIGKLPYRVKTTLVGYWNGWLYFTSGQRDRGPDDPSPRKVIGDMWRTKLSF
ncbi:hypothetical protein RND81_01G142300 [Saponaria officinalis]|uniref:Kelch repeat-containing protein n=1 Tax=Saponaria officinalis TaxID=3572 RepID=A0AAW1NEN5_SAPOF